MNEAENMGVSGLSSQIFVQCLGRFEVDAQGMVEHAEVVRFFCQTVLPFLAENTLISHLRSAWKKKYAQVDGEISVLQDQALGEVLASYHEMRPSLSKSKNAEIRQQIALLEGLTKHVSPSQYHMLSEEVKTLLHLALHAGYVDLCKRYAQVASRKKNDSEDGSHQPGDELYVDTFTLAPSVIKAYEAIESVHVGRFSDPATVWGYFEAAMWCWKTPRLYFEQPPKRDRPSDISFELLCNMSAWMEIASARDRIELQSPPVVFTSDLFQRGLGVVINAIGMYLAGASLHMVSSPNEPEVAFTLILDGNELWVHATYENRATEKFFIQAFHEGDDRGGSSLFKFVKSVFASPQKGKGEARLSADWETASKHISRLKLPEELKRAFFERKAHGSTYYFAGIQIRMKNPGDVMRELQGRMEKLDGMIDEVL